MARFVVKLWNRRDMPYAGKLTVLATDEIEQAALKAFKLHVGNRQTGNRLDVVFRWPGGKIEADPNGGGA